MSKEDLIGGNEPVDNNTPPVDNTPPSDEISIEYPENFPQEFHGNATIMKFVDKESNKIDYGKALSSLVHAQKLVGADKIMLPSKTATEDDWKNVFHKLGNPQDIAEYKINVEGFNVEDPMSKGFIETAHSVGILPKQAEKIVSFFNEANEKMLKDQEGKLDEDYQSEMTKLKDDWGDKYDNNLAAANKAFKDIFTAEEQAFYQEKGLLADPVFVRAMSQVSKTMMDDDSFKGNEEVNHTSQKESMQQSYRESYAIVMSGDKTNPSYEHHRRNLHKLNEKAGQMGISLV